MAVHILGNGPSVKFFKRQYWPSTDIVVGCNFSDEKFKPNYTVLIDVKPLRLFGTQNYRLRIPTVLSDKATRYIHNHLKHRFSSEYITTIKDVYPIIHWSNVAPSKIPMNSGQHAIMYAIQHEVNQDTFHIWGIDTFWQDDLVSLTDAYTRPNLDKPRIDEKRAKIWRAYWYEIFLRHSNKQFIIHCPLGFKFQLDFSNLSNVSHQIHSKGLSPY